jgi:hypothetical protein
MRPRAFSERTAPSRTSDPGGNRTHDLAVKSRVLYQLSYRVWVRARARPSLNLAGPTYRWNRVSGAHRWHW